jgi:putative ABC transport system permease protein
MRHLITDVTYAMRSFRKKPAFAITAIGALGLGIGATAAIFSVVDAVLLTPLPYQAPARLVHVWQDMRNRNVSDFPWPPADFHDFRVQTTSFEGIAALATDREVIPAGSGYGEAELLRTGIATPNLFRVLGTRILMGSDFADADGTPIPAQGGPAGDAPPVAEGSAPPPRTILSYQFWQRRFGGDPATVGSVVHLGDQPFEVIGVLEPGFELLFPPGINIERMPDLWTPLRVDFAAGSRINVFLRVIARLKPGVSRARAQGEAETVAAGLRAQFPIKQTAGTHLRVEPMHEDLVADVRPAILALMGAVTFVLLIACANVANLLLIRAAARERELALRTALGSTRGRLVGQLLAESVVLAGSAAIAGVGLAWIGIRLLLALGPDNLPRLHRVAIDPAVIAFAAGAGLVSAIVFGLVPAVRASRPDVMDLLRKSGRTGGLSSGGWLRSRFVTLEVALSFVLLVGSGLMIRSFMALQRVQPGYQTDRMLTFLIPDLRLSDPDARRAFMRDLRARLRAMPGVEAATAATPLPLDGRTQNARWGTEAALTDPTRFQQATTYFVVPGYFEAMRTRVIEGRTFSEEDNSPDARLIVIDRRLASKAFPGQSAVGRTLLARVRTPEPERFEVIISATSRWPLTDAKPCI